MKALFISYNQAIGERVMAVLNKHSIRGFTRWVETEGRGSFTGEPRYGTHAWPSMNSSILAITDEKKVKDVLEALRELDSVTTQGVRAFVWDISDQM